MDRFGLDVLRSFEDRVNTVVELAQRGYAEKMVLAPKPHESGLAPTSCRHVTFG